MKLKPIEHIGESGNYISPEPELGISELS